MRKCKSLMVFLVCGITLLATACSSGNAEKTDKEEKTVLESEVITKVDTTTVLETTTVEETTTVVETTTVPETTTVEETTTMPETTTVEETTTALTVTELNKTMYVKSTVNVRSGPAKEYEKIGSLSAGKEVKVTGQSDQTGWYRIDYNGKVGYVSDSYLQSEPLPKPETTTKAPAKESNIQKAINSATLNPFRSDFTPAYEELDKVFAQIFTDSMTTYDKVKACYDYLINNCSYGNNEYVMDYIDYYFYGYSYEVRTYGILKGKIGVCDDYSAAFATMMQALGLNCYVVGGQTSKSGGGYTGHAWCEMNINGTIYVFDPQVEDNIAKGGSIKYYRFGKTYEQVPGKYIKEE